MGVGMSLSKALKAFRRSVYVHGPAWRGLVLARNREQVKYLFEEAALLLSHGSLPISEVNRAAYKIKFVGGASIDFASVEDEDKLRGSSYTDIMYPDTMDRYYMNRYSAVLRSAVLEPEDLRMQTFSI